MSHIPSVERIRMRFRELGASVLRQWIVVVLGLALTAGASYAALRLVPISYRATAHVLLLPGESTLPEAGNPFLHLGGTHPMRDILSRSMMADEVAGPLLEGTIDTSYEVVPDGASAAPAVVAVVEGPTVAETLQTLDGVLVQIDLKLAAVQDELAVPTAAQITGMAISVDQETDEVQSSTTRAVVATAALGLVLTFVLAIWVDSIRGGRLPADEDDAEVPARPTAPDPA